jgi:hypothetical protein
MPDAEDSFQFLTLFAGVRQEVEITFGLATVDEADVRAGDVKPNVGLCGE